MRAADGKIHIRLFRDEYDKETWESICTVCEVANITNMDVHELKSLELTVDRVQPQIW